MPGLPYVMRFSTVSRKTDGESAYVLSVDTYGWDDVDTSDPLLSLDSQAMV